VEIEALRELDDTTRSHEALGFLTPLEVYRSGYNLFRAEVSKNLDSGHTALPCSLRARSLTPGSPACWMGWCCDPSFI
jgi:hypothetical protein